MAASPMLNINIIKFQLLIQFQKFQNTAQQKKKKKSIKKCTVYYLLIWSHEAEIKLVVNFVILVIQGFYK